MGQNFVLFCWLLTLDRELNKLVMDYFVVEGFKEAAEKFQKESGTDRKYSQKHLHNTIIIQLDTHF
jgi:molybdopterin-guanine dinucleotide biosynthesis protein